MPPRQKIDWRGRSQTPALVFPFYGFFDLFRGRKKDTERIWRDQLLRSGRIPEGVVLDIVDPDTDSPKIVYSYCISGADYESAQVLDEAQRANMDYYVPGQRVTVRYEPRRPGNSLVV
jgi:hypothetical protein